MNDKQPSEPTAWFRSRTGLVLLGLLAIIGFFLVTEHRAHLFGILPFLLLLLCPVLHWLLHGGHEGYGESQRDTGEGDGQ